MNYLYAARSMSGELTRGVLAADSAAHVRRLLREKGLFAVEVTASTKRAPAIDAAKGMPWLRKRVPKRELLTFTSQLAVMARSGTDLATALQTLSSQVTQPVLRDALQKVHGDVSAGKPVSAALAAQGHVFGGAYVAIVAAGEASGRLPEVLARLTEMLNTELKRSGALRAQLAYPVVLSSVSLIVIGALLFFVLPRFAEVFADADMPLPMITRALLAFAGELRRYLILWIALAVGLVVGGLSFRSSQRGRAWIDGLQLHNPLINKITRALLTGRSFRLLGMMLESGVPLLEALRLTRTSVQNLVYRELFVRLEEAVLGGQDMSPTVAEHTFVPSAAAHMLATGERTGNLASVSQIMGEFYEEEGESRLKAMMTVMEPLIIVVLGVIVACIVLAVMIPMFDFATFAQHQK